MRYCPISATSTSWVCPPETISARNGNCGGSGFEERREQMAFQMMDGDRRAAPGVGEAAREAGSHQKRADEARAGGVGDAVDALWTRIRVGQRLAHQREEPLHMIPGGDLGNHPAIGLVQRDLAVEPMGQEPPLGVDTPPRPSRRRSSRFRLHAWTCQKTPACGGEMGKSADFAFCGDAP